MATRHIGLSLFGAMTLSLLAQRASAALPNCEPATVLAAASGERQAMILRALNFYSFYPNYSQTACVNVVSGAKKSTGGFSGGCDAGGDWWRTDCSGFASFVWGLAKSYNCNGLGTSGTDAGGHAWESESFDALQPGDALNNPTEHIMIFTGWLDDAHTKICTIQELNPTQADKNGVIGCTTWPWKVAELKGIYTPIHLTDTSRFNPTPAQSSANDFISLVNWPDGHAEAFVRTTGGGLAHTSSQAGDAWSTPELLDGGVACGSTANYWPNLLKGAKDAEVVSPLSGGGAGHLWWSGGSYGASSPLGTASLSHLQSVAHFDGNLEVFALGADGAIHSNKSDRWADKWSDWQSLGGSFRTGASAIVWNDGHTELFATGTDGTPQHDWIEGGTWHGWAPMKGELLSRPVPVRWADGHVEVFATGADHKLQRSSITAGEWSAFEDVEPTTEIAGDPSVLMNVASKGVSAGPEVFARSMGGKIVHLAWDGTKYGAFTPVLDQSTFADPMGWVRQDDSVEIFAVDPQGDLVHSKRDAGVWSAWASIGGDVDACAAKMNAEPPPPPPPSGWGSIAKASAGSNGDPDPGASAAPAGDDAGANSGCGVPAGSGGSSALGALVMALGLAAARGRRARSI